MNVTISQDDPQQIVSDPLVMALLDTCSDGAVVIDPRDRRVLSMNRKARELFGYAEGEALGCLCKDALNSPTCVLSCPLEACLDSGQRSDSRTLFYRGRDGRRIVHAHARMLVIRDRAGRPVAGIEMFRDLSEYRQLERDLLRRRGLHGLVGSSEIMQGVYELIEQLAPYGFPVLIIGEQGSGRRRVAEAIGAVSTREPFIRVACSGLDPSAALLLGNDERRGLLEQARGGTLLLDDVGALGAEAQRCLAVALRSDRAAAVRLLATSDNGLRARVDAGTFDAGLHQVLSEVQIRVPPLRDHLDDIPELVAHFLGVFASEVGSGPREITQDALTALMSRPWAGNVGELKRVLRMAARRMGACALVSCADLAPESGDLISTTANLLELEQAAIARALERAEGNVAAAARLLGINRTTLWRKLKRAPNGDGLRA